MTLNKIEPDKIVDLLADYDDGLTTGEIAEKLEIKYKEASNAITRAYLNDEIITVGGGIYENPRWVVR